MKGAEAAAEAGAVLRKAGIKTFKSTFEDIVVAIHFGTIGAVLTDEETLVCHGQALVRALAAQPGWSFLPMVVGAPTAFAADHADLLTALGNVRFLQRPIDPAILVQAARASLFARQRQRRAGQILSERERAESERLRDSEQLYRFTLELSGQLVWTATPSGRISYLSPSFSRISGLSKQTDPHEGWLRVMHPDDYHQILGAFDRTIKAGEPNSAKFRMRVADGSYRTFIARAAPLRDEAGNVVRWYGYTQDVEDQVRAEEAQRAAEERYRLAAKATNDAVWDLDWPSREIHWSESAAECLGYPGPELGTTTLDWWADRVHPEDRQQAKGSLEEAIRNGRTRWSAAYRFRQADGGYATFFDRGFIVRNEAGEPIRVVGAMTDLSERQRAEDQIRRMQGELIHVSRLSAMGTMASTLAHELNQPLTAVSNYIRGSRRLLEERGTEDLEQVGGALAAAEGSALRAGQIVRRLRELVARGIAAIQSEDLPKLVEEAGVIAFVDADFLGVAPRFLFDPAARWVQVDRIQIQQVLINLIRNSVQAMQEAERREIVLETRRVSATHVEVSVADTGPGISPDVRNALFSPFQGTKAEGLGIGLSISRTIIEAHGGKIWAEDRQEGGTVFRFTLPLSFNPPLEEVQEA
jgi:two-component system sensor kinase FixL